MVQSNTLYAPKTGLYLPGTSGNYVSTPDVASLDLSSDFSFILDIDLFTIPDTGIIALLAKAGAATTRSYYIRINNNILELLLSSDGISLVAYSCSVSLNNSYKILGVTRKQSNGEIVFWYKDAYNNWLPLGSTVSGPTYSVFNSTAPLEINRVSGANENILSIFSAQIYSGIGDNSAPGLGTLVAEADFSYPWANNKYTDATGKVWTINGSAWAWEYQDDPEDKYTPTPEIWGGDAYQLINDQINNSSSALHVLNGGNARGY